MHPRGNGARLSRGALVALVLTSGACGSTEREGFTASPTGDGGATTFEPGGSFDGGAPNADGGCTGGLPTTVASDVTLDPAFAKDYVAYDLGAVPGMPKYKYGGLAIDPADPDTLLVGGNANEAGGAIYAVKVVRSACKHITGFSGSTSKRASARYIDGGLALGPGGVLVYAAWPLDSDVRQQSSGFLGIIPPGASAPSPEIPGTRFSAPEALAAVAFVPPGFPGAGKLKIVTWEGGTWFDAQTKLDGSGRLVDVPSATSRGTFPGGPEGFAYVPTGSAGFAKASMLLSEWSQKSVGAYEVGPDGDPLPGTRRTLLTGLSGAEGAFFDPLTGDFLFSTWNFDRPERLVLLSGFQAPAVR